MTTEHEKWLNLTTEEVLEPALPICDAHHHFWKHSDRAPFPPPQYLLNDLLKDINSGHNIVKTVFMECEAGYRQTGPEIMKPVGQTDFVRTIIDENLKQNGERIKVAAGIIGFADLTQGKAIEDVLIAHIEAGKGSFKGIRHPAVWDPDPKIATPRTMGPGLMYGPKFREGFACLARHGLVYDAWQFFHQLPDLADLANAFPDTTIILDHFGTPLHTGPYQGKREKVMATWKAGIDLLSKCPNVFGKLGGLGMPRYDFGWEKRPSPVGSVELAEAMSIYFTYCINKFSPYRCLCESNFPVDKNTYSYNILWNAFKRLTKQYSKSERAAMLHDTAVKVYKL